MIHEKIAALRRGAGMSQQEVADAVGVSRQTVSNWELGQGSPSLDKAAELARIFGVSLDDLANDGVGIVSSGRRGNVRDLHVLEGLVGMVGVVECGDVVMQDVEILGVSNGWLRVSHAVKTATFGKPRVGEEHVVQLIDLADVQAISVDVRE